jgi:hypothetical protein
VCAGSGHGCGDSLFPVIAEAAVDVNERLPLVLKWEERVRENIIKN